MCIRDRSVPRASQERPRASQELPKSVTRAPKSAPRAAQEPLKSAQRYPRQPSGCYFEALDLEKVTFEGDPSRDSVEKRVQTDFRWIVASCAQERTCEKPTNNYRFL